MLEKKSKELPILIQYGAPAANQPEALKMVQCFSHDPLVINICHEFYSHLPEAEDDYIKELYLLEQQDSVQLFLIKTTLQSYFYLVNRDKAELVGSLPQGPNENVLNFFGFGCKEDFSKKFGDFSNLTPHSHKFIGQEACPSCFCPDGTHHVFGCPVEVCPWCDGQLTNCNCRFDQLNIEEINNPLQLEAFLQLLNKKGRIPYNAAQHCPSYPVQSDESEQRQ